MSIPNPPNASRRHYRRWEDCRIWREFFMACLRADPPGRIMQTGDINAEQTAKDADACYAEYRKRFPVATPRLDNEDSGLGEIQRVS